MSKSADRRAALRAARGPADLVALGRAVGVGALVPLVIRLSLPHQAALLEWGGARRARRPRSASDTDRIVRAVEGAQQVAHPLVRRGCLTRAVVLYWLLGRGDEHIELCFGAGRVGGEFCGHAWLTKDGRPYLERVDPTSSFQVTYRIPGPQRGEAQPAPATTT